MLTLIMPEIIPEMTPGFAPEGEGVSQRRYPLGLTYQGLG